MTPTPQAANDMPENTRDTTDDVPVDSLDTVDDIPDDPARDRPDGTTDTATGIAPDRTPASTPDPAGDTLDATLRDALGREGIRLPDGQIELLDRYCQLLWHWNQKLNLTRHTDYTRFVQRDVVDSMHLAEQLQPGQRVLDVGTGGGVPGVILAIVRPDVRVELCESVAKKCRAVADIVHQLQLAVAVHHGRAEDVLVSQSYDVLVARAVGPLWKLLHWIKPHWNSIGTLLLVKGPAWLDERRDARDRALLKGLQLRRLVEYRLPESGACGVILGIRRS